jgi:hypothetical protein
MGAVVQHEPVSLPAISESAAIIQVIERAAMNPNVDIDKMERLLQMQERIMERQARASYMSALADMQLDLPEIPENGKGHVNIKYALWEDINELIRPVLGRHGFSLSFRTGQQDGKISVTGVLSHREGHSEETTMQLPTDTSGSKNAVQAVGSSTSYGKRYVAQALLNLTSRNEDDDGQNAGVRPISAEQRKVLQGLIEAAGGDVPTFCSWAQIESLAAMPEGKFAKAKQALEAKARQNGAAK